MLTYEDAGQILARCAARAFERGLIAGLPGLGRVWFLEARWTRTGYVPQVSLIGYGGLRARFGLTARCVRTYVQTARGIPVMATLGDGKGVCRLDLRNRTDDGVPVPPVEELDGVPVPPVEELLALAQALLRQALRRQAPARRRILTLFRQGGKG